MLTKLLQIAVMLGMVINTFAQIRLEEETKSLETYNNGEYSGSKEIALPVLIERFLPKVLLVERKKESPFVTKGERFSSLLKQVKFLRATEYIFQGTVSGKNGTVSVRRVYDRLWFPSVGFKDKIYIFAGEHFDTKADAEIFNLFLKQANLKIENEREAAELANLYFSVTRGYFENKGKLILSGVEDVPLSYRKSKEVEAKRLKTIISSPKTMLVGESYAVELFTWEMTLGEVRKWNFKIQPDTRIEVQSKTIGKL